jgi:large subunit ribosomal protein L9
MKIILLDNIKKIGVRGAVVTVADGLALGKLIPEKKAIEATPANLAKLQSQKKAVTVTEKVSDEHKNQIISYLRNNAIQMRVPADHNGTLYQQIKVGQLYQAIKPLLPASATKHMKESDIAIIQPIKKTGVSNYQVYGVEFQIEILGE